MTLSQLRTFVAVAEAGSVQAAAARLHVTQPAVSAAIRALEESVGVELMERHGRGSRLTAAGRAFASYARRVLGLLEEGEQAAHGTHDPTQGTVRIAATTTAAEHLLPRSLALFRKAYPDAEVVVEVGNKQRVWAQMRHHEVDVVLAGRPAFDQRLAVRAIRPNQLVVVGAPDLVAEVTRGGESVPLTALESYTWLLREPGSGTRATLEGLLARGDVDPPLLTLGSNGAVAAGTVEGLGMTLISRDAVGDHLEQGSLEVVPLAGTPLRRPWHAVTHQIATATTELFVAHLLDPDVDHPEPRFRLPENASVPAAA